MPLAMFACCLMGSAHLVLGLTQMSPMLGMIALSLPEAIMPTILRSTTPLVVSPSVFGLAFGAFGVAESFGKTIGAPLVGYIRDQEGNYLHVELGFATASFIACAFVVLLCVCDHCNGGSLSAPICWLKNRGDDVDEESAFIAVE